MYRGFTTLSATLGKLAVSLHDGLLQAAASEADPAVLASVLRLFQVLITSAQYLRLPPTLLPRVLTVRSSCALPEGRKAAGVYCLAKYEVHIVCCSL